jgi:hypothetical protein
VSFTFQYYALILNRFGNSVDGHEKAGVNKLTFVPAPRTLAGLHADLHAIRAVLGRKEGQAAFVKQSLKSRKGELFAIGFQRFT